MKCAKNKPDSISSPEVILTGLSRMDIILNDNQVIC